MIKPRKSGARWGACRHVRWLVLAGLLLPPICVGQQFPALPALNIDITETSISGLSSGAFLAVQFEVAHSSIIKGIGIIAGGPYYCAQNDIARATTRCSCTLDPAHSACSVSPTSTDVGALERATGKFFAEHLIDDPHNLAQHRVYVLAGEQDPIVPSAIASQLSDYYGSFSVTGLKITVKPNTGHTMPTLAFGNRCSATESPYIGRCGYDAAQELLSWIYGPLQPKQNGALTGRFSQFDQTAYVHAAAFLWLTGMDTTGWIYVPRACAQGERCRLHVALHGCEQGQSYIPDHPPRGGGLYYGTTFVRHAGYAPWADTNHIVVLFPQAVSIPSLNPSGCWDWWGYTDGNYANQHGAQIAAIRAMVDQIASGRH